ncbi:MAG: diguanylate cyclase [Xenococcaceae cyanobacterium MO_167.B27]|nr:diguanylate cyclase [Xenococcaceae cyanobacterium MO_167.B27]
MIEDDIADADWIEEILTEENIQELELNHVNRLGEALEVLSQKSFDAILLDLSLPDSQGIESLAQVKQKVPQSPIIVLTALNDQATALQLVREGAQDYLVKGRFEGELLLRSICYAIERQRTEVYLRQQALMKTMLDRIRESLNLTDILSKTVDEVRQFLKTDRVLIYRCESGHSGEIIADSIETNNLAQSDTIPDITNIFISESHSPNSSSKAIEDVISDGQLDPYTLAEDKIRSILTLAIWRNPSLDYHLNSFVFGDDHYKSKKQNQNRLWGMLVANHFSTPRKWLDWEIEFLEQLTTQVTIAIQQSELCLQLENAIKQLEKLAILDGLTGIANRRYFEEVLKNEWQRLAREKKYLSLILCDIDYFKLYNDTYGHLDGDICLQKVSKTLQESTRRPADLVARYGGEEFAIILPDTDAHGALFIANKIRQEVEELKLPHSPSPVSDYVTLSVGVVTLIPHRGSNRTTLVKRADDALYEAKQKGRNQVVQG